MNPIPTPLGSAGAHTGTGISARSVSGSDPAAATGERTRDWAGASSSPGGGNGQELDPAVVNAVVNAADAAVVVAVRAGQSDRFGELVARHSPRLFAVVRKYERRDDEVADVVQEIWLKAFRRLELWRGDAPFSHWLMRLAVNACLDHLRAQRRQPIEILSQLSEDEQSWLDRHAAAPETADPDADAARSLVQKVLAQLSPSSRLVIQLLELEDRSLKEISQLTGWSVVLVKVRAFRARREMRKLLERLEVRKYL